MTGLISLTVHARLQQFRLGALENIAPTLLNLKLIDADGLSNPDKFRLWKGLANMDFPRLRHLSFNGSNSVGPRSIPISLSDAFPRLQWFDLRNTGFLARDRNLLEGCFPGVQLRLSGNLAIEWPVEDSLKE